MTSTDRAFIRAFHREKGSSAATSEQHETAEYSAVAPAQFTPAEVVGLGDGRPLEELYTVEQCTFPTYPMAVSNDLPQEPAAAQLDRSTSDHEVPTSHDPPSSAPELAQASSNVTAAEPSISGDVRPLSSFVDPMDETSAPTTDEEVSTPESISHFAPGPALQKTFSSEAAHAQEPFFQAALEVDQFLYPRECERLISEAGDAFDQVARKLLATSEMGRRVIAVAGCRRAEGRTTGLLCIARRLAALGARVAVVDADFEKPDLAARLGLAVPTGWDDVLRGELGLAEAVVETRGEQISLVPLREPSVQADTAELGHRAADDLATLGKHFDVVLVDLGPVLDPRGDAVSFAQAADIPAALLVRDARRASQADFNAAATRLSSAKVAVIGTVESFAGPDVLPLPQPVSPVAKAG
jgi:Mrp family chromosome partitioning ATPase